MTLEVGVVTVRRPNPVTRHIKDITCPLASLHGAGNGMLPVPNWRQFGTNGLADQCLALIWNDHVWQDPF